MQGTYFVTARPLVFSLHSDHTCRSTTSWFNFPINNHAVHATLNSDWTLLFQLQALVGSSEWYFANQTSCFDLCMWNSRSSENPPLFKDILWKIQGLIKPRMHWKARVFQLNWTCARNSSCTSRKGNSRANKLCLQNFDGENLAVKDFQAPLFLIQGLSRT